jgi:two-component system, cell cycle response regulator DivK
MITSLPVARILLVEDNEVRRDMLPRRLARKEHAVILATDGAEAVAPAARELPGVILWDPGLPVSGGVEAVRRLRAGPATRSLPIIALTGDAMSGSRERAPAVGGDDHDGHPVERLRLLRKLDARLGAR